MPNPHSKPSATRGTRGMSKAEIRLRLLELASERSMKLASGMDMTELVEKARELEKYVFE